MWYRVVYLKEDLLSSIYSEFEPAQEISYSHSILRDTIPTAAFFKNMENLLQFMQMDCEAFSLN